MAGYLNGSQGNAKIDGCENYGAVTGEDNANFGGICGCFLYNIDYGADACIKDCTNYATIAITTVEPQGVCGSCDDVLRIINCKTESTVAKIGDKEYTTLAKAVEAANKSKTATIQLIGDSNIEYTGNYVTINNGSDITIDLNGKKIVAGTTSDAGTALFNVAAGGKLTFDDTSAEKDGSITTGANPTWNWDGSDNYAGSYASNLVTNRGTVVVKNGLLNNVSTGSASYVIDNYDAGKVIVDDGTLKTASASVIRMFYNNGGEVTVNGGVIESEWTGIQIQAGTKAAITVNDGTISGKTYALCVYGTHYSTQTDDINVAIHGGTFNGTVETYEDFTVDGGIFNDALIVSSYVVNPKMLTGGTFNGAAWVDSGYFGMIKDGILCNYTKETDANGNIISRTPTTAKYPAPWDRVAYWEAAGYTFIEDSTAPGVYLLCTPMIDDLGNYIADGYEAVPSTVVTTGDYVDVVEKKVAKIGETTYNSLEKAVAAAKSGDTIVLLASTNANIELTVDSKIKLNENGFAFTGKVVAPNGYHVVKDADGCYTAVSNTTTDIDNIEVDKREGTAEVPDDAKAKIKEVADKFDDLNEDLVSATKIEESTTKFGKGQGQTQTPEQAMQAQESLSIILDALKEKADNENKQSIVDAIESVGDDQIGDEDVDKYLTIKLESAKIETIQATDTTTTVRSMSYDIKPIAVLTVTKVDENGQTVVETTETVIPNEAIKAPISFRLPVASDAPFTKATVTRDGEYLGIYNVDTDEETGERYIELASDHFSTFEYQGVEINVNENTDVAVVIHGDTATKYGTTDANTSKTAALEAAVANAVKGDIVLLLCDVDYDGAGDDDYLYIEKNITLDLGGRTLSGKRSVGILDISGVAVTVTNGTVRSACTSTKRVNTVTITGGQGCIVVKDVNFEIIAPTSEKSAIEGASSKVDLSEGSYQGYITVRTATIKGGTYNGAITADEGEISGGTFNLSVTHGGKISGGTFNDIVEVQTSGSITGGTFNGAVNTPDKSVSGGRFTAKLAQTKLADDKCWSELKTDGYYYVVPAVAEYNGVRYESVAVAVNAAHLNNTQAIKLLAAASYTLDPSAIASGEFITIDVNGFNFTPTCPAGFEVVDTDGKYSLKLKAPTVNSASIGGVYSGEAFTSTASSEASGATFKWFDKDGVEFATTAGLLSVTDVAHTGTYTVKAYAGNGYESAGTTVTVAITKADYDMSGVTFTDDSKSYTGTEQSLVVGGTLPTGADDIQVTVSYSEGLTNVGEKTITATFATTSGNYNVPEAMTAKLTITKVNATITPNNASKIAGNTDPEFDAEVTGTVNNETLAYTLEREEGDGAGTYMISVVLTPDADVNKNYNIDATAKAAFTISASAAKVKHGEGETYYSTLVDALNAAEDGDIVALCADYEGTIKITKGITLDFGTFVVTGSKTSYPTQLISVNAPGKTVTFTGTTGGVMPTAGGVFDLTAGDVEINGGNYRTTGATTVVFNGSSAAQTLTINGGTISNDGSSTWLKTISGLDVGDKLIVNDGEISIENAASYGYSYLIETSCNSGLAKVEINGGTLLCNQKETSRTSRGYIISAGSNSYSADRHSEVSVNGGTMKVGGSYTQLVSGAKTVVEIEDVNYTSTGDTNYLVNGVADTKVSGGTYNIKPTYDTWNKPLEVFGSTATAVSGGTFTVPVSPEKCADNFAPKTNVDEQTGKVTYGVIESADPIVAKITDSNKVVTYYTSLKDAIAAVTNDQVIELTADIVLGETLDITKYVKIESRAHNVSTTVANQKLFKITNKGTLYIDANYGSPNSTFTGRFDVGAANNDNGNLILYFGNYTVSDNTVIHVNGTCDNCKLQILNAKVTSTNDNAIQMNGGGTLRIANSTVTGATGVYMKAGTLNFESGTIKGNGEYKGTIVNHNGSDATGDAIVLDAQDGYKGQISVNIDKTGSAKIESVNGSAIREAVTEGNNSATVSLKISNANAKLTAADGKDAIKVSDKFVAAVKAGTATSAISAGTYSSDVPAVLCEGLFRAVKQDNGYKVMLKDAVAEVNGKQYTTFKEALEAANEATGDVVIKILVDEIVETEKYVIYLKNNTTITTDLEKAVVDLVYNNATCIEAYSPAVNLTIGDNVEIKNLCQTIATKEFNIYGRLYAQQFWAFNGGIVNIMPGAYVEMGYGDGMMRIRYNGTINITGNLAQGDAYSAYLNNTIGSLTPSVNGGYFAGDYAYTKTLNIKNAYVTTSWIESDTGKYNTTLDNTVLKLYQENGTGNGHYSTGTVGGTLILKNGSCMLVENSVILGAKDTVEIEAGSTVAAKVLNISGGKIIIDARNATANKYTIIDYTGNGTMELADYGEIEVNGEYAVKVEGNDLVIYKAVAKITVGETTTYYATFAEAIAAVPANGTATTITMLGDETIVGNAGVTVAAGQNIVLDLNGKTIKNLVNEDKASQVITNKGILTIKDSSVSGDGKIMNAVDADTHAGEWWGTPQYNYATNVILNQGTLTVESGEIYQSSFGSIAYAIDNNSTASDAKLIINNGLIKSEKTAIRSFANSTANVNEIILNNGVIEAGRFGINVQSPNVNDNKASLVVNGGKVSTTDSDNIALNIYGYQSKALNIDVNGGEFVGDISVYAVAESTIDIGGNVKANKVYNDEGTKTNFISGGTFTEKPAANLFAEGYAPVQNTDCEWVAGVCNVTITREGVKYNYNTLAEAVAAAQNGDKVTILNDCSADAISIDKNLTLDLNGHTVTKTPINGEIGAAAQSAFTVKAGSTLTIDGTDTGSKIVGGIVVGTASDDNAGLVINGGTYQGISNDKYSYAAIQTNGGNTNDNVSITNATVSADEVAVYAAGKGTYTVKGSTITGATGIAIKAGDLTVENSTIKGTGDFVSTSPYNNGVDADGSAILIESNNGYKGDINITFVGDNNVVESTKAYAINETVKPGSAEQLKSLVIPGGTFKGASDKAAVKVSDAAKDVPVISGGSFSSEVPLSYCASGFIPVTTTNEQGMYTVSNGLITDIYTEADLRAFAKLVNEGNNYSGKTVTLMNGITMSDEYFAPIGTNDHKFSGTFEGNGKTISNLKVNTSGYAGLFGFVFDAKINNLTIDGATITGAGDYQGIIVAHGYAKIEGCTVKNSTVNGGEQVGGIIGYLSCGFVKNCTVEDCSVNASGNRAGGITGKANVDSEYEISGNIVTDSAVTAAEKADGMNSAAGLVGQIMASGTNTWSIHDNNVITTTTKTGEDSTFVPVGEFRSGSFQTDALDHIYRNHWEGGNPDTLNGDYDTYELKNPANAEQSVTILNFWERVEDTVTEIKYNSVNDALAAGATNLKMLMNSKESAKIDIDDGKEVVLDLNGKTLTSQDDLIRNGGLIIVHNGGSLTVNDSSIAKTGMIYGGAGTQTNGYARVYAAVALTLSGDDATKPATFVLNGGTVKGTYYGITGNGSRDNTAITINGGKVVGVEGTAIYHPQTGTLTVTGGEIEGRECGIEMRAGTLNVTGGKITGKGNPAEYMGNGSGTSVTGAAIGVSQHTTKKEIYVNISGGELNGKYALWEVNAENNSAEDVAKIHLYITDGKFDGKVESDDCKNFISGGEFNGAPANDLFVPGKAPVGKQNEEGWFVVGAAVAKIGNAQYASLEEAVANAVNDDTIVLLADCSGNGIALMAADAKTITIDLNNHKYTVNGELVGSTGTKSQAFHFEKGNTVTIKNGTLATTNARMFMQNYADLTLDGVTLDGTGLQGLGRYVLSNNSGDVTIKDTKIIAKGGDIAMDTCKFGSYDPPAVTLTGSTKLEGNVELSGGKLTIPTETTVEINGSFKQVSGYQKGNVSISGGTFSNEVPFEYCAKGEGFTYVPTAMDSEGMYSVESVEEETGTIVARVVRVANGVYTYTYFSSLQGAIKDAGEDDTVQPLVDLTDQGVIIIQPSITLDLNGHDIQANIVLVFGAVKNSAGANAGKLYVAADHLVYSGAGRSVELKQISGSSNTVSSDYELPVWNTDGYTFHKLDDIYQKWSPKFGDSQPPRYNCAVDTQTLVSVFAESSLVELEVVIKYSRDGSNYDTMTLTVSRDLIEWYLEHTTGCIYFYIHAEDSICSLMAFTRVKSSGCGFEIISDTIAINR